LIHFYKRVKPFNMPDPAKFLSEMKETSGPDLSSQWVKVEELYNKKLWHQLTVVLQSLIKEPSLQDKLITLYQEFIVDFEARLDPLSLVLIGQAVMERFTDPEEAVKFVEKIEEKTKMNKEAFVLTKVLVGKIKLHKYDQRKETKLIIEEAEKTLDEIDGVSPVHSQFYLLCSDLYRIEGDHRQFYSTSLKYLGCTELEDLSQEEQAKHAFFLSLAALLGDKVYNFGELLAHKVLESLRGTENAWLIDLLFVFNSGDVSKFKAMKPQWETQADLKANENKLFEKVCLLCLMEMTFRREATARQIAFTEIAKETTLPVDCIELLIMKALSQGLVKGRIDEVDQSVMLTWVQPRVLDRQQVESLTSKIDSWCQSVLSMEMMIDNKAGEILTY